MPGTEVPGQGDAQRPFYDHVLERVRRIMVEDYGLRRVTIRAVSSNDARLSIPISITGLDKDGGRRRYFCKIMGSSDLMSARSMQLVKNLYLRVNGKEPLFGVSESVEDMARAQHDGLLAIHRLRIPTSRPHGYHWIDGSMWLLVLEFLDARPISKFEELGSGHVDTALRHLRTMHRNGIYHGDIKPDNIMVDDEVHILDVGQFDGRASATRKQAYDLASMMCAFVDHHPVEGVVGAALKHHKRRRLRAAAQYVELVQRRPDFDFSDETRDRLVGLMNERGSARSLRRRARRAGTERPKGRRGRLRLRRTPK